MKSPNESYLRTAKKVSYFAQLEEYDPIEFKRMPAKANAKRVFERRLAVLRGNVARLETLIVSSENPAIRTVAKGVRLQHRIVLQSVVALAIAYNDTVDDSKFHVYLGENENAE